MSIREATLADAAEIAKVNVDSRRTTYCDILPPEYLSDLSYAGYTEFWQRVLEDANSTAQVFVSEDESRQIVGFVCGGPPQKEDAPGEGQIYAIYLLESHQRRGLGRHLMTAIVTRLAELNVNTLRLFCFEVNSSARRFYETLGGQPIGEKQTERNGASVIEVAYHWPDIKALCRILAVGEKRDNR